MKNPIASYKQSHLFIISLIAGLIALIGGSNYNVYAHEFADDESASFLALLDKMQGELNLINNDLLANNQSLANDHFNQLNGLYSKHIKDEIAEKNKRIANEISMIINDTGTNLNAPEPNTGIENILKNFNDVSLEAVTVRITPEALNNATVHALHFGDLINYVDLAYATAFDTKPMNMSATDMHHEEEETNMTGTDMAHEEEETNMTGTDMAHEEEKMNITNLASYQTAKELTNIAIDLYNSNLKEHASVNATEKADSIEAGLQQLKESIEAKKPYTETMGIIHGLIQTNLKEIFNLPVK